MWINTLRNRIFAWTSRYDWLIKDALFGLAVPFLGARVQWFGEISPLLLPLLLVCVLRGENIFVLFAGAALGLLTRGLSVHELMDGCAVFMLCALCYSIKRLRWPRWLHYAVLPVAALIPVIFFAFATPGEFIMRVVQLLLCMLFVVVLYRAERALSALPSQALTEEGRVFLLITICLLLTGLNGLNIGPVSLMRICAVLAALIAAQAGGAAAGAALGLLTGACVSFANAGEAMLTINISVAALSAGALRSLPRPVMGVAFIIANAIASFMENSSSVVILPLLDSLIACAIFILLPKIVFERVRAAFCPAPARAAAVAEARLDINEKAIVEDKLRRYSHMFLSLSQTVARNLESREESIGDTVLELVRARACEDCALEISCWEHDFEHTRQTLSFCLSRAKSRTAIHRADVPQGFLRRCLRQDKLVGSLCDALSAYNMQRAGARSLQESRRLISDQLMSASHMFGDLAGSMRFNLERDLRCSGRLQRALEKAGFDVHSVHVDTREGAVASVALGRIDIQKSYGEIAGIVSGALARKMRALPAGSGGEGEMLLSFTEAASATPECGVASRSKFAVSGDSTLIKALGRNKFALAISDGMGQGSAAATESAAMLALTEHFIEAEIPKDVMINSLNQALKLGAPSETFATLDLMIIDMRQLNASFVRMGAAPLYICSGGKVECISSPALPIGIVDSVSAQTFERRFQWDDLVVMMSDGVSDRMGGEAEQLISVIAENAPTPQEAATLILQAALSMCGSEDDMTVVVIRLAPYEEL